MKFHILRIRSQICLKEAAALNLASLIKTLVYMLSTVQLVIKSNTQILGTTGILDDNIINEIHMNNIQ